MGFADACCGAAGAGGAGTARQWSRDPRQRLKVKTQTRVVDTPLALLELRLRSGCRCKLACLAPRPFPEAKHTSPFCQTKSRGEIIPTKNRVIGGQSTSVCSAVCSIGCGRASLPLSPPSNPITPHPTCLSLRERLAARRSISLLTWHGPRDLPSPSDGCAQRGGRRRRRVSVHVPST